MRGGATRAALVALALLAGCSGAGSESPTATLGRRSPAPGASAAAVPSASPTEEAANAPTRTPSPTRSPSPSSTPAASASSEDTSEAGGGQDGAGASYSLDPADYAVPERIDGAYVERILGVLSEIEARAAREAVSTGRLTPDFFRLATSIYTGWAYSTDVAPFWEGVAADGYRALATEPGPAINVVESIVALEPCLQAAVTRDYSALTAEPLPARRVLVALVGKTDAYPDDVNPTPWIINYEQAPGRRDPCLQQAPPPPPPPAPLPPAPPPSG